MGIWGTWFCGKTYFSVADPLLSLSPVVCWVFLSEPPGPKKATWAASLPRVGLCQTFMLEQSQRYRILSPRLTWCNRSSDKDCSFFLLPLHTSWLGVQGLCKTPLCSLAGGPGNLSALVFCQALNGMIRRFNYPDDILKPSGP